ncbi:MAG TPA: ROK family transcriptional regulator [Clostridiaceae bacterium]|nr:ROK family transcriptional regulator [Clostridiaceae bacterium]
MSLRKKNTNENQTANLQLVKETNITLLFNLIYKLGPISRAELAQRTKLSPTTVSSLVEELISDGIIIETGVGETTTSGRKPIMLEINPDGGYILSFEMMKDALLCEMYDLKCNEVSGYKEKVADYGKIGQKIIDEAEKLLKQNNISEEKLLGISIALPGLINIENKRVTTSTVIPIDENNDFFSEIKQRFSNIPVFVENQSYLCAYAEKEFGIDEDIEDLVFIDINVGIGAGIIIGGNVFKGSFGLAGEVGHITIDMNGPKCKCGNRGCLEIMANIPAIIQKIIFAIMSGRDTIVKKVIDNDYNKINMDIIKYAIENNDELVMEIMNETAMKLAFGINNVINLYNPQVVVIGGEITKGGSFFLEKLNDHLHSIELKPNINKVKLKYSILKKNAATLGGARYVLDNIFRLAQW